MNNLAFKILTKNKKKRFACETKTREEIPSEVKDKEQQKCCSSISTKYLL